MVPRRAALAPQESVVRGLAILAIVWQGLWILPDPTLWPTRAGSPLTSILLTGVVVAWLAVVAATWGPWADPRRREIAQAVNLLFLYAAAVDLFLDLPVDTDDGWRQGASLVNLAIGLTGLLLRARTALPIALTAVLVEAALLVSLDLERLPTLTLTSEVLYPLYALAITAATIGGRRALVLAARRTALAEAELARAAADAESMRRVDLRLREQERLLHETVLNTLNAIARGGLQDSTGVIGRIRERCAESAGVLAAFAGAGTDAPMPPRDRWSAGVEPAVALLRDAGVEVVLDLPRECEPPDEVRRAFLTAMVEALANAHRHAGARRVSVRLRCDADSVTADIVDDGIGFDPHRVTDGFGLAGSIRAPLEEVDGLAVIESAPGGGTRVRLSWRQPRAVRRRPFDTSAFVQPVLLAFGALTLASAILTLGGFAAPAFGVAALLLALAAGVVLALGSRGGALSPAVVIGVCLSAPLILRLQMIGLGQGAPDVWSEWSSEAIVGLMLVIAAAGPWWGWLAALATWVVTQGDVVGELLRPGTAIIVAGGLFARSVRANAEAFSRAADLRAAELASASSDAESIRRTRERYSVLAQSDAEALLRGIAGGTLDPLSEQVRTACGDEERFIRSVMRLDPASGPLHAFAARLAVAAHHARLPLEIDLAQGPQPTAEALADLESRVLPCMAAHPGGEPARLTARVEGEELVVRLVMRVDEFVFAGGSTPAEGIVVQPGGSEPVAMWELRHG